MAAAKSMNLSTLFGMIALLVAVLAFGTWYRSTEGFQTPKLSIDQLRAVMSKGANKDNKTLRFLMNDKKSTTAKPDFSVAMQNLMKHVDMPARNTPEFLTAWGLIKKANMDMQKSYLGRA